MAREKLNAGQYVEVIRGNELAVGTVAKLLFVGPVEGEKRERAELLTARGQRVWMRATNVKACTPPEDVRQAIDRHAVSAGTTVPGTQSGVENHVQGGPVPRPPQSSTSQRRRTGATFGREHALKNLRQAQKMATVVSQLLTTAAASGGEAFTPDAGFPVADYLRLQDRKADEIVRALEPVLSRA